MAFQMQQEVGLQSQQSQQPQNENGDSFSSGFMGAIAQGWSNTNANSGTSMPTLYPTQLVEEAGVTNNFTTMDDYNNNTSTYDDDGYDEDAYYSNKWLLILPRVFGTISLFAIVCVAMEAWKDLRQVRQSSHSSIRTSTAKNVSVTTHIQLFYQIPLFCYALSFALGSMMAPKGQAWGAIGNNATCSLSGFLLQFGLHGTVGWDAALSISYILMVRYKVAEVQLQSYKKYFHLIIWPMILAVSIYPLTQQMYNLNGTVCWLESYPNNCEGDECLRGAGAPMWQNAASLLVMLHMLFSISVMMVLYCAIRKLENQTIETQSRAAGDASIISMTSRTTSAASHRRKSRAVGVQGMYYASAMICTVLPTPVYIVLWNTAGIWNDGFAIFATSIVGLSGYVNFCIFMRRRSVANCRTAYGKFLRRAHFWMFDVHYLQWICRHCCWWRQNKDDGDYDDDQQIPITTWATPNSARQQSRRGTAGHGALARNEKSGALPSIIENDTYHGEPPQEGAPKRGQKGWKGFVIKVKEDYGQRMSQWVSELGVSAVDDSSSGGGWSEYSEDDDDDDDGASRDNAPSRPMRFRSEVEQFESFDSSSRTPPMNNGSSRAPPCKPRREQSEVEAACTYDVDAIMMNQRGSNGGRSVGAAPPNMPTRFDSEIEQALPPLEKMNRRGSCDQSAKKPVRYESEVEQELPPLEKMNRRGSTDRSVKMPVRCESEIEQPMKLERPPTRPERFVSELETSESETESSLGQIHSITPPRPPRSYFRYNKQTKQSQQHAPPSLPLRLESEAETVVSEESFGSRRNLLLRLQLQSDSTIEASEGSTRSLESMLHLQQQPPNRPYATPNSRGDQLLQLQLQSDTTLEASESSIEVESILQLQKPQQRQAQPPSRPSRIPSELDESDSTKHNGSSHLLLELDAIPEHSRDSHSSPFVVTDDDESSDSSSSHALPALKSQWYASDTSLDCMFENSAGLEGILQKMKEEQPRQPEQQQQPQQSPPQQPAKPPTHPLRFPSEFEESVSKNTSSSRSLMSLDAITEDSTKSSSSSPSQSRRL